jgi:hypothetical protein
MQELRVCTFGTQEVLGGRLGVDTIESGMKCTWSKMGAWSLNHVFLSLTSKV